MCVLETRQTSRRCDFFSNFQCPITNTGYALIGRVDPSNVLLPVHIAVDNWKEPDVDEGSPILLYATVTVESLSANRKYTIVRYDDIANIPTDFIFVR